jgi:hypothetical protein
MRKEIYVYLLDEGTDVLRPIEAEYVQEKIYKIIFKNDSKKNEKWEFSTGDYVRCEEKIFQENQKGLVAVEKINIEK